MKTKPKKSRKKGQSAKSWLSLFGVKSKKSLRSKKNVSRPWALELTLFKIARRRIYLAITQRLEPNRQMALPIIGFITFPFALIVIGQRPLRGRPKKTKTAQTARRRKHRGLQLRPAIATAVVAGIAGTIYFSLMLARPTYSTPPFHAPATNVQVPAQSPSAKPHLTRSLPVSISVPAVGISGQFIQIGRLPDNTLQTPPDYESVGWYKDSPTPGEIGPAVAVGHVDSYKGPAVFWSLRDMQPGQIIEITRQDGKVAKFKVDSVEQFMQNNFPTERVYGAIDYAGLRLITCAGEFDQQTLEYNQNTIVFASFVE